MPSACTLPARRVEPSATNASRSVVFPLPLGAIRPVIEPGICSHVASRSTPCLPYASDIPCAIMPASFGAGCAASLRASARPRRQTAPKAIESAMNAHPSTTTAAIPNDSRSSARDTWLGQEVCTTSHVRGIVPGVLWEGAERRKRVGGRQRHRPNPGEATPFGCTPRSWAWQAGQSPQPGLAPWRARASGGRPCER